MATGPEHYREAERLLGGAQNVMDIAPLDGLTRTECAELAQVHATLALAAATALNDHSHSEGGMPLEDYDAWVKTAGVWQRKATGGDAG